MAKRCSPRWYGMAMDFRSVPTTTPVDAALQGASGVTRKQDILAEDHPHPMVEKGRAPSPFVMGDAAAVRDAASRVSTIGRECGIGRGCGG